MKEKCETTMGLLNALSMEVHYLFEEQKANAKKLDCLLNNVSDLHENISRIDQILETKHPGCVGEWEEEYCEGGGKCPSARPGLDAIATKQLLRNLKKHREEVLQEK